MTNQNKSKKIKVAIFGANGYTGYELLRLLSDHPNVVVTHATSRAHEGKLVGELYGSLKDAYHNLKYCGADAKTIAPLVDAVFVCLPHGASSETVLTLQKHGSKKLKIVDLSADFRYDNLNTYNKTYGVVHPSAKINTQAVYGLPELNRNKIKTANIVANPGCYPTSIILALLPLIKAGLIKKNGIIADSKSGASGAGRQSAEPFSICELGNNFKAYGVTTHRHTSEIEEKLDLGVNSPLIFTPHLLPIKRGILSTIYADLADGMNENSIKKTYDDFYQNEPFLHIGDDLPELADVVGSNMCNIGYRIDKRTNRIIIVSAIDNLIKGASGAAIANLNIMCGLDETTGLPKVGCQL